MTPDSPLDALRREIDAIDSAMHDLLMRRTEVVGQIGALKGARAPKFRPGREAAILRTLAARHLGPLPKPALVALWRQLIAAFLGMQGPFSVAALNEPDGPDFGDLARMHFGHLCAVAACATAKRAIEDVTRGRATVGILPVPEQGEMDPWWPSLLNDKATPRVVARLPFAGPGNSRSGQSEALVIGLMPPEASGNDRTLLTLDADEAPPLARVQPALKAVGLKPHLVVPCKARGERSPWLCLVEVDGFIEGDGGRTERLAEHLPVRLRRLVNLGSYPVPLSAAELAQAEAAEPAKTPDGGKQNYGRRSTDKPRSRAAKRTVS
ncbi:MAG: chorismate mutase [Proteobacteria bacterium]|nr:chorismate mutase [Pseudomonadota bacterium]